MCRKGRQAQGGDEWWGVGVGRVWENRGLHVGRKGCVGTSMILEVGNGANVGALWYKVLVMARAVAQAVSIRAKASYGSD